MEEILLKMKIAKAIYIICAFVPIIIFAVKYKMQRSETVGFFLGLGANVGMFFAGIFSLIAAVAFESLTFEIICIAAVILISGFLYYSVLVKYITDPKVAVSFSLGLSQASMLFCILVSNLSANDLISRVRENHYPPGFDYISDVTGTFLSFIIMAAVKIILIVMSAYAAKKIYSSKKFTPARKAVISSVLMVICGICADILLIIVT